MKALDEVSLEDITSTVQQLLSSPLTMATYGDGNFPLSEIFYLCFIRLCW